MTPIASTPDLNIANKICATIPGSYFQFQGGVYYVFPAKKPVAPARKSGRKTNAKSQVKYDPVTMIIMMVFVLVIFYLIFLR